MSYFQVGKKAEESSGITHDNNTPSLLYDKHPFDKHQPHVGKALVLGPTWTLPQKEMRRSCECHVSPARSHASQRAGPHLLHPLSLLQDQLPHAQHPVQNEHIGPLINKLLRISKQ